MGRNHTNRTGISPVTARTVVSSPEYRASLANGVGYRSHGGPMDRVGNGLAYAIKCGFSLVAYTNRLGEA